MTNKNQRNAVSRGAALVLTGLVAAGTAPPAHADRAGMDLIRKMVARYRSLRTYSDSWTKVEQRGRRPVTVGGDTRLARPNRFFLSTETNGRPQMILVSDGRTSTVYLALRRQYAQEAAPAALPPLLRGADHLGVRLFAGFDLADDVEDAVIVGSGTVNGTPVRVVRVTFKLDLPPGQKLTPEIKARLEQLRASQPDIRYHIGTADQMIYRVEMTAQGKTPDGKDATMTVRQDFRNVRTNQSIPPAAFAFTPPPRTTRYIPPKAPKKG